jgi:hypothetical protein
VLWTIILIAVAIAVAIAVLADRRYYERLFSEAHFKEVYDKFALAVRPLNNGRAAIVESDEALYQSTFVTSADLAVSVTAKLEGDRRVLHVSLSQASAYTTSAVAGRFGFFLVGVLRQNEMNLDAFFTRSRVHHLVFASEPSPLHLSDFDGAMNQYRRGYRPIRYARRSIH